MSEIICVDEQYYLKVNSELQIEDILSRLKENTGMRKGSFADKYVIKIMSGMLNGAVNLGKKYVKYYSDEYSSFTEFLYKKELMDNDSINKLFLKHDETIFRLNFIINDYSIKSILGYENENLPIINQLLGAVIDEI